jgi:hypothetical protein
MMKYQLHAPASETEFEVFVNELCTIEYGEEFQVFGRKGSPEA